eukprot:2725499-Amphidinium_carterae.1
MQMDRAAASYALCTLDVQLENNGRNGGAETKKHPGSTIERHTSIKRPSLRGIHHSGPGGRVISRNPARKKEASTKAGQK